MKQRTYIAIDLKSFYASVECRERGLDPMDTNLVRAGRIRPSALPSRPPSRAMASLAVHGCLRSSSTSERQMPSASMMRRDAS